MTLVGVPLSVEKEVSGQLIDGAVLLGRGAGRKWACEEEFLLGNVQRFSSSQSQGFTGRVLGISPGWLADTVVSYCPSRSSQL